jgi:malate synthase
MLTDKIREMQEEVQADPWLLPMFDPTIPEQEKRTAVNSLITQTAVQTLEAVVEMLNSKRQQLKDELSHYVDGYYTEKEDTDKQADEFIDDLITSLQAEVEKLSTNQ